MDAKQDIDTCSTEELEDLPVWNIKSTSLQGEQGYLYVGLPKRCEKKWSERNVYKLHRTLYGNNLERLFNHIETRLINDGFQKCPNDQTSFNKMSNEGKVLVMMI